MGNSIDDLLTHDIFFLKLIGGSDNVNYQCLATITSDQQLLLYFVKIFTN